VGTLLEKINCFKGLNFSKKALFLSPFIRISGGRISGGRISGGRIFGGRIFGNILIFPIEFLVRLGPNIDPKEKEMNF
jgi:hypothetical protein